MASHDCPECADPCSCLAGSVLERNCTHCDDVLEEGEDDDVIIDDEDVDDEA